MNRIFSLIFSPKTALILLLTFAISMATATFIENDFGTQTARQVIYNAWWFEVVMVLLGLNFIGNIFRYNLLSKKKIPLLLFHLAFIVILIGAGITRYSGFEGIMRIREGESSNIIISERNYLQATVFKSNDSLEFKKEAYFSPIKDNHFELTQDFNSSEIKVDYINFIADASLQINDSVENGTEILEIVLSDDLSRRNLFIKKGESKNIGSHSHLLSFESNQDKGVRIFSENGNLNIISEEPIDLFIMATQVAGKLEANTAHKLQSNALYKFHDFSFVLVQHVKNGVLQWKSQAKKPKDNQDNIEDVLLLNLSVGEESKELILKYKHGFLPDFDNHTLGGLEFKIGYGALPVQTDFFLELRDFQLEKYPGSTSPSSYASEVTVLDGTYREEYRIFMNNVLDYKGHRFFQASYDTDEKGTVLAVNKDRMGTVVTYIGYFLMGLGMFLTFFSKGSRFNLLRTKLNQLKTSGSLAILIMVLSTNLVSGMKQQDVPLDSLLNNQLIDEDHAANFGRLMVQDLDGRIKPVNTLASEFLRKVSRKTSLKVGDQKLDANQVFLAIHMDAAIWSQIPLIRIDKKKGGKAFESLLTNSNNLTAFENFIDKNNGYILEDFVLEANEKKPGERNEFDKEVLTVDERFNVVFNVLSGNYLKIFPKRDDVSKTWYNPNHDFSDFEEEDSRFAQGIIPIYFNSLQHGKTSGNWAEAEDKVAYINKYQQVLAADIIPSQKQIEAELWYNELNLNFWLFQLYFLLGISLLVLALMKIFSNNAWIQIGINLGLVITLLAFILHGFNLILRWYVAEHPPWSNGYEMIIFVAWSLMLFGLIFNRKSDFALPLSTIFSGTLLFVSYLDWLNPEITNLMPVLKSYWLKVHVATIISSYAPLALSALLGLMAQLLIIIRNDKNETLINSRILEITYINEMSMTIGLFVLSIGTFLGGIWANESWGRYWAWDPKETWALISIIVYSIVLHLRFVPKLNNALVLNIASTLAFFSIVMTSFGVNYYLTGLHSYATGDPVPIPNFVYVATMIIISISAIAHYKYYNRQMN